MAMSQSVAYKAPSDKVWGLIVKTISTAGYAISQTDGSAKSITYNVPMQLTHAAQIVQVSVVSIEPEESLVTIMVCHRLVEPVINLDKGHQRRLIEYICSELDKVIPRMPRDSQPIAAPGTTGCAGVVLLAISSVTFIALTTARVFAH